MRRSTVVSAFAAVTPLVVVALLGAACTKPVPEAETPRATDAQASERPSSEGVPAPPAPSAMSATPAPSASSAPSAAPADAPPVHVKVETIGMHVGGGPYDEVTKEPIKRSVEPHFADLARCWTHIAKEQPTDVGVDLVIEASGGRARVSNPRTTAPGEGFLPCVVAFFETVDFQRPKNGKTVVSYSVRFTP